MTPEEIKAESTYRRIERLAIMCDDRIPTADQMKVVREELAALEKALTMEENE